MDDGTDVREFRKVCIDERVRPRRSLLMRAAMSGAWVTTGPAGNAKLAKGGQGRRSRCRDDAAALFPFRGLAIGVNRIIRT